MFKITSFFGGKKAVKGLGAFCFIVFLIPLVILGLGLEEIRPEWIVWVFLIGAFLGLILLLGGSFASDIPEEK